MQKKLGTHWANSSSKRKTWTVIIALLVLATGTMCICGACNMIANPDKYRATETPEETAKPVAMATEASTTAKPTNTTSPTRTPAPTLTPEPTRAPLEEMRYQIAKVLKKENRLEDLSVKDGTITVRFALQDLLIMSLTVDSAYDDMAKVLQVATEAGVDYATARIEVTAPMKDKYGNTSQDVVIWGVYSKMTVGKINWTGFRSENILNIADQKYVHQQFQREK